MEIQQESSSSQNPLIDELERKLSELTSHDKPIVVCRDGSLADSANRDSFYETLFASFRRNRSGIIEVRGGRASENGVFVQDQDSRTLVRICHPVHLETGKKVILAKRASFTIPGNDQLALEGKAESDLFSLSPGERCVLGRNEVTPFDTEISARHITVIRLQDSKDSLLYRVIDGVHPADNQFKVEYPLIDNGPGRWIEAPDWYPLRTGRKVKLGEDGPVVRIPLWKRNPLANKGEEYFHQDTQMRMHRHYFSFPLPTTAVSKIPSSRHHALEFIQHELDTIFELLFEERVELAHARMLSTSSLASLGMKHVIDEGHAEFLPTDNFDHDSKVIEDLFQHLATKIEPHNDPDLLRIVTGRMKNSDPSQATRLRYKQSKQAFLWMLCLIECEQWCFTYQNLAGSLVSRRGALIHGLKNARHLDSALFLEENSCPLSEPFLSLYNRKEVLHLLHASQESTAVQQSSISLLQALFELIPGKGLTLTPQDDIFHSRENFPRQIAEELSSFRIVIERLYSGFYRVKQDVESPGCKLFAPDSGGIWCELPTEQQLTPGTPLRIGRFYEVMLP